MKDCTRAIERDPDTRPGPFADVSAKRHEKRLYRAPLYVGANGICEDGPQYGRVLFR